MSIDRYRKTQQVAESTRQTEYRLFAQITGDLVAARDKGLAGPELADPLHRNREMWTVLANDCGAKGNNLPPSLRASIISLSIFVNKHSSAVMRGVEKIDDLIEINRNVMAGLSPSQAQAA